VVQRVGQLGERHQHREILVGTRVVPQAADRGAVVVTASLVGVDMLAEVKELVILLGDWDECA
jgi:hypothetical protein